MRVIGAGLAVFLAVTAILLSQITSGGHETIAIAVIASPEPTATATPSATPSPSPTSQTTRVMPTATMTVAPPTATVPNVPVEPTTTTGESAALAEDPELVETELVEDGTEDEAQDVAEEAEPNIVDDEGTQAQLAGIDTLDAWSSAIETPNGGKIGTVLSGLANVRALPSVDAEVIDTLHAGWPVAIYGVVSGDIVTETSTWYQVSGGGYIAAELIGPYVPREPEVYHAGHWVDVDLTHNVAVAYMDNVPVNAVIVITGKAGFETPVGDHAIFARVENETLDSATVGIPKGDPEYYYLPDVPHTQYFADGGFAIHANYWSDSWQFGSSTSHGCVNMFPEDAAWFWSFLDIGSVVSVRY